MLRHLDRMGSTHVLGLYIRALSWQPPGGASAKASRKSVASQAFTRYTNIETFLWYDRDYLDVSIVLPAGIMVAPSDE